MSDSAERVVTPMDTSEDRAVESRLRPKTLEEYVGQPVMREKLEIYLEEGSEISRLAGRDEAELRWLAGVLWRELKGVAKTVSSRATRVSWPSGS